MPLRIASDASAWPMSGGSLPSPSPCAAAIAPSAEVGTSGGSGPIPATVATANWCCGSTCVSGTSPPKTGWTSTAVDGSRGGSAPGDVIAAG